MRRPDRDVLLAVTGSFALVVFIVGTLFITTQKSAITSPLPVVFDLSKNSEVTTLSLFLPDEQKVTKGKVSPPIITAKAALIYDMTSDTFLYQKNIRDKLPVASLIKILTATVALENKKPDTYIVDQFASNVGENSMGLSEGEKVMLEELLYGLMLASGNDAAETIAANTLGGREAFIEKMNDKAKSLGLKDTLVLNPSGLEEDGKIQFSTAYDMLVMTKYAASFFPEFLKVTETPVISIQATAEHKTFYLENQTNLLTTYPGVRGIKTGYTDEAGLCLITYAENGGHKLIGVVLNSESRREEMRALLDYSFQALGVKVPKKI